VNVAVARSFVSGLKPRRRRLNLRLQGVNYLAKDERLEVQILERREIPLPSLEGEPKSEMWITYRYGTLPPGLIRIPKEKWTKEEEARAIKADIQARLQAKPEVVRF